MSLLTEKLGTLTISSGQTTSPALSTILSEGQMKVACGFLDNLKIYVPHGLAESVDVQMSPIDSPTSADWDSDGTIDIDAADLITTEDDLDLEDENSDNLETEGMSSGGIVSIDDPAFKDLRLVASAPVASDRAFRLVGKLQISGGS